MKVMLENVRLSFPALYTAKRFAPDQDATFQASGIFPKGSKNTELLRNAEKAVAQAKWGEKAASIVKKVAAGRRVVRDGDLKSDVEGYGDDVFYVQASNTKRPLLLDRQLNAVAEEDDLFYAGCYVNLQVELWAQDNQYGKAVNCQLKALQFVADGESFGGGAPATAADFSVLDGDSADDWDDGDNVLN